MEPEAAPGPAPHLYCSWACHALPRHCSCPNPALRCTLPCPACPALPCHALLALPSPLCPPILPPHSALPARLPALLRPQGSLDEAAVERLKDDDAVSLLFSALSEQYPQVGRAGWAGGLVLYMGLVFRCVC